MTNLNVYKPALGGDFAAGSRFAGKSIKDIADTLGHASAEMDSAWQECLEAGLAAWFQDAHARADKLSYAVNILCRSQPERAPTVSKWFTSFQDGYRIGRTKSGGYSIKSKPGHHAGSAPTEIGPIGMWFDAAPKKVGREAKTFDLETGFDAVARKAYKLDVDVNGMPVTRSMALAAFAKAYDRAMSGQANPARQTAQASCRQVSTK